MFSELQRSAAVALALAARSPAPLSKKARATEHFLHGSMAEINSYSDFVPLNGPSRVFEKGSWSIPKAETDGLLQVSQ
jgi:hypothetical protein